MELLLFFIALLIGGISAWQIYTWRYGKAKKSVQMASSVLLEKIEKVFKVVLAEGQFTEIYDHKSGKDFLGLFSTNKKALIVTKAKVSIGFDFSKLLLERDEKSKKISIVQFPEPEVLSIDTDYKFYDINQGWLHKFNTDDYTQILTDAKSLLREKALESQLPSVAKKQLNFLLAEIIENTGWKLEYKNPTDKLLNS